MTSLRVSAAAFSTSPQDRSVVWVTGYQPFGDFTFNPSEAVASGSSWLLDDIRTGRFPYCTNKDVDVSESLNGSCSPHYCIQTFSLPVTHGGASQPARWLREADVHKPAAIVHLGLEDRAKGLKLEIAAKNVARFPDAIALTAWTVRSLLKVIPPFPSSLTLPLFSPQPPTSAWSMVLILMRCGVSMQEAPTAMRSTSELFQKSEVET